jgi:hypothetical protein
MERGKMFLVFGEKVEIVVPGEATNGASAMLIQTSPPDGGPPLVLPDDMATLMELSEQFGIEYMPPA